jgi:hypothetical protein
MTVFSLPRGPLLFQGPDPMRDPSICRVSTSPRSAVRLKNAGAISSSGGMQAAVVVCSVMTARPGSAAAAALVSRGSCVAHSPSPLVQPGGQLLQLDVPVIAVPRTPASGTKALPHNAGTDQVQVFHQCAPAGSSALVLP